MSEEKKNNKKKELEQILRGVVDTAPNLETQGRNLVRSSRLAKDIAKCVLDLLEKIPSDDVLTVLKWDRNIGVWQDWHDSAGKIQQGTTFVSSLCAITSAAASIGSSDLINIEDDCEVLQATFVDPRKDFFVIMNRTPLADEARESMRRLKLDVDAGSYRTPLDLLNEAQGALEHPTGDHNIVTSVLLPLRECIETSISELLRRRPSHEATPKYKDKVSSIGQHCGRPHLKNVHFTRLGEQANLIINKLSEAKQKPLSSEEVRRLFHDGLLFLKALIKSIDESRLKPV